MKRDAQAPLVPSCELYPQEFAKRCRIKDDEPDASDLLKASEVPKVRFDFGYDDIEGGNLLGKLLGSLQEDRLSVAEAPQSAASSNLKVDRAKPCQRCEVLLLQLDALAQSMVGLAGAAFRWSLEVATGVSTEDREMLWKALMSYMQPCAHVDARIASTSEDLLKAVTKAVTPDELLGSLAQQRLEQKRAQPKGAATAPQAKVKAKAREGVALPSPRVRCRDRAKA
ncbi:Uncharacterized protein SCF082_LOCUS28856 [Durusdinium trenchii]|uniref:Uncharacterized protein n=1 Tax=Durusdinium trenchii TaxID=1381693 RepID=A0ABP0MPY0_9DINO